MNQDAPQAPEEIAQLAEACVRYVREALQLTLDYSPETLPILDHYLRERASGAEEGVIELLAPTAGAYFGEVVRRHVAGARWHCPDDEYPAYRIEFEPFFLAFNPIGVALEVLYAQDVPGWGAHFQLLDDGRARVMAALEQNPEVRPRDYYTLSMRYEVLEQVTALLTGLEAERDERRVFGPEVYRAAEGKPRDRDPH